jgi:ribosome biogenesis GTPase A
VAARHVLKDYTNGKLLYVQLRPDYTEAVHGAIVQSGYNIDMTPEEEVADAQAYERLEETKS